MEFIFFLIGVLSGIALDKLLSRKDKIYGIIEVDHIAEACKVLITSDELSNRKNKKAVFKIDHNANFSRDKQGL